MHMKRQDFYFDLPDVLIAQVPLRHRPTSRLMVLERGEETIEHKQFSDLTEELRAGDLLVVNDTKVLPARLYGKRRTGAAVEFLLLKRLTGDRWETMVKPGRKAKIGDEIVFGDGRLIAEILEHGEAGTRIVQMHYEGIFEEILDELGHMPLPPYITEELKEKNRYQTVYAKQEGSAAAPTAGLHFDEALIDQLKARGIRIAPLTLHVGLGTFRPVKADEITDHEMHAEYYDLSEETADLINETKKKGGRVIAVGTTSTRTLESIADESGVVRASKGWTDIFIYPGYQFKCIDGLITNFHLPESTLIMLVSALYGRERTLEAYRTAVKEAYRFFSFGDAMLIKPPTNPEGENHATDL